MKVVLDANVYVSTQISQLGKPHEILDRWMRREFEVLITQTILDEVSRVLRYPRIVKRHQLQEEDIAQFIDRLSKQASLLEPEEKLDVVADESDNRYLECAVAGSADYLVTGDQHLLEFQAFQGTVILTPAEFVTLLRLENQDNG